MRLANISSQLLQLRIAIKKSVSELGVGGILFMALFWSMVPLANTYFYIRNLVRGTNSMTGLPTPRIFLALPFVRVARFLQTPR